MKTVLAALVLVIGTAGPALADDTAQGPSHKAGFDTRPGVGGPASVAAQLEHDDEIKLATASNSFLHRKLGPYYAWKRRLDQRRHLKLGLDYNVLVQRADNENGDDDAAGGVFRLFGTWTLTGRPENKRYGQLVFKLENRHALGGHIPPSSPLKKRGSGQISMP